ncbi:MAG: GNAT family N-acetyltransferase [Bdellovibrionaceae bacterium]|nr:GNAT family N-acetyltransferase [Bdellovibrio sp.]
MKKLERKTKRLLVRPFRQADFKSWKNAYSSQLPPQNEFDWHRIKPSNLNLKFFNKLVSNYQLRRKSDKHYALGVFDKKSMALIGKIDLLITARYYCQNAVLGYSIINNYWGQGFGKEAVVCALQIAFKDLNLHRLEAGIELKNKRSISLIKAIGFRREGHSKKVVYSNKKWLNLEMYAATCEDFGIRWSWAGKKVAF